MFSIFVSLVETISVSAIMAFIDIATNFDSIASNKYYQILFIFFGFSEELNFAVAFGFVLLVFYVFRGIINLIYTYSLSYFAQTMGANFNKKIFKTYLAIPYQLYVGKNSSYLTRTIVVETSNVVNTVTAVLLMISETFIILFLYALMLLASWKITIAFTFILLLKVIFLAKIITAKIKLISVKKSSISIKVFEVLNKTFGNFKHIKLQRQSRIDELKNNFNNICDAELPSRHYI